MYIFGGTVVDNELNDMLIFDTIKLNYIYDATWLPNRQIIFFR